MKSQRIRKAANKSPGNQQKAKKELIETNNRLTLRKWRRSERAGAIDCDVTYEGRCILKKNSLAKHNIDTVIEKFD